MWPQAEILDLTWGTMCPGPSIGQHYQSAFTPTSDFPNLKAGSAQWGRGDTVKD